ncbi:MAG: hypothetical protein RLZZ543_1710 [Bacteroidota bacterium]|jgi:hypothetical protein
MLQRILLFFFSLFLSNAAYAQSLESGFEALKEYDFFKAKKVFSAKLKKNPAAANYGMALIRFDALNHFHSLDSAYVNVVKADSAFALLKPKQQLSMKKIGVSDSSIQALQNAILLAAFEHARKVNQPAAYAHYQQFFDRSPYKEQALELEMKRAYAIADSINTSVALLDFITYYPSSPQITVASVKLDDVRFREGTAGQSIEEFKAFIQNFPKSEHRGEAEDALYALMTPKQTRDELYAFVKQHPSNRNTEQAWEMIYADFTSDQRVESFEAFKKNYPEYPYPDRLNRDSRLASIHLYPAVQGELWGFVDSTGKTVLTWQYEEVWSFSENLAMVRLNGKVGYISKAGIRVVPAYFNDGEPFKNQLAIVELNGLYGLIDPRGKIVLPIEYDMVQGPENGFYQISKEEKNGFVNRKGEVIIPPTYENTEAFSDGLAAVTQEGLVGFIDSTGKLVIPCIYDDVNAFESGRARVMKNDFVGLIDHTGREIIPIKNDRVGKFQEGLARVSRDSKCAFFDAQGKEIIKFQPICSAPILGVDGFSEGLARVERKGKKGYMNKKGKLVIPMEWEESGYFSSNRATFKKKNRWGYINTQGKAVIEPQYEEAYPFHDGKARAKKKGKYGLIGTDGAVLIAFEWDELTEDNGWFIASKNGKVQLFAPNLKPQLEEEWIEIRRSNDKEIFQLSTDTKLALYHTGMKKVFWEEH